MRLGNRHLAAKITAMQEAAKQNYDDPVSVEEVPSTGSAATNNNKDDNLKLNNVLAAVTDKIVGATVTNDGIGLISLENRSRSPPKSKCSSLVSSPDSDTPLRGAEDLSPVTQIAQTPNLSKSLNEFDANSKDSTKETFPVINAKIKESGEKLVDFEMSSSCKKSTVVDSVNNPHSKRRAGKHRNTSGGGAKKNKSSDIDAGRKDCVKHPKRSSDKESGTGQVKVDGFGEGISSKPSHSQSSSDGSSPNNTGSNNRNLKSGHARTHAIVINLDDKNRFTEEVTV